MKLYTKTGDEGNTSLYDGSRLGKDELVFDVLGNLDELSSQIGLLCTKINLKLGSIFTPVHNKTLFLREIQSLLLDIGSNIATRDEIKKKRVSRITENHVADMEKKIDECDSKNKKLTVFLILGEEELDALCHVCRAVARRTERSMWKLQRDEKYGVNVDENILKYMNRLSDFFFAFARNLC